MRRFRKTSAAPSQPFNQRHKETRPGEKALPNLRLGMTVGSCVLVVDDDPGMRRIASLVLRTAGFEVKSAENGQQALDVIKSFIPVVVILDLQMPIMDGRSFFRAIEGPDRPAVLIVSAYGARSACQELAAEAYLPKPYDPDQLIEKVEGLVARISDRRCGG